jgi:hypothetical protein
VFGTVEMLYVIMEVNPKANNVPVKTFIGAAQTHGRPAGGLAGGAGPVARPPSSRSRQRAPARGPRLAAGAAYRALRAPKRSVTHRTSTPPPPC